MNLADLQLLMHQLGPATPEITTIVQEEIDSWMIEFDEEVSMQIAWDQRSTRVLMKCAIGKPDENAREETYRSLLNANMLLTGVAEVKLALSEIDDDVILIGEYGLTESTLTALQHQLSEFLGFAGKFSQIISNTYANDSAKDFSIGLGIPIDQA